MRDALRLGLLGLSLLLLAPLAAAEPVLIASVKPLQMLIAAVSDGLAEPELLIPATASPHSHALKPSQLARLQGATAVFWFGPSLEGSLAAPLAGLPEGVRVERLLDWPEARALPLGEDGHGHAGVDAHVWLDPLRAKALVLILGERLAALDPEHGPRYRANAAAYGRRLDALDAELRAALADKPAYWLFHPGYRYFEARYGLKARGVLGGKAEHSLAPSALARLAAAPGACVLVDRQYRGSQALARLAELGARIVELDPLGQELAGDGEGYLALMRGLAQAFGECR
ncbi:MAG: zinc ABC transporter substrate-binding protein [Gammaproteobacteria bacterium]|nr:zinc ABC transporter substrate-binding protein [Gammaproteobacteria bacterium]